MRQKMLMIISSLVAWMVGICPTVSAAEGFSGCLRWGEHVERVSAWTYGPDQLSLEFEVNAAGYLQLPETHDDFWVVWVYDSTGWQHAGYIDAPGELCVALVIPYNVCIDMSREAFTDLTGSVLGDTFSVDGRVYTIGSGIYWAVPKTERWTWEFVFDGQVVLRATQTSDESCEVQEAGRD